MSMRPWAVSDINAVAITARDEARFFRKVSKGPGPADCWTWIGNASKKGYGNFFFGGKDRCAHRVAFVLSGQRIPGGLTIDHLCRNTRCVRPDHLRLLSRVENTMDGASPPSRNARKTHCPHGHPYSGQNLILFRGRFKRCRTCTKGWDRNRRARLAEKR